MRGNILFSILFIILAAGLLISYLFLPFNHFEFVPKNVNNNFTLDNINSSMQFYPNMRFPEKEITYRISNCPLQKGNDMTQAFDIIQEKTILTFNPISSNEEISVTCDDTKKTVKGERGVFIAGEGGPSEIIKTDLFNVITKGEIVLISDSSCQQPNVAVHELLHVLGFDHSANENNIMYPVSNCNQAISSDMLDLINHLYSFQSYADLAFANVSASINGRYLDSEINLKNNGLKKTGQAELLIYSGNNLIKTVDINPIDIGEGLKITLKNNWFYSNSNKLEFVINSSFEELSKENNQILLQIKK